jgi:hypothetical protein
LLGQHATGSYFLVMLAGFAAHQGRAKACRRLAEEALAIAIPRQLAVVAAFASWSLGLLDLTQGQPAAALERLLALNRPQQLTGHTIIALLATGTLVEAAARADALEGMERLVARLEVRPPADATRSSRPGARQSLAGVRSWLSSRAGGGATACARTAPVQRPARPGPGRAAWRAPRWRRRTPDRAAQPPDRADRNQTGGSATTSRGGKMLG